MARALPWRALGWLRKESGATIIEFAFVAPVLLLLLLGAFQAGLLIFMQHEMTSTARETVRRMVTGEFTTTTAAESYAQTRMATKSSLTFTYSAQFPTSPSTTATMSVSIPMSTAAFIDVFGLFQTGTLEGTAAMRME